MYKLLRSSFHKHSIAFPLFFWAFFFVRSKLRNKGIYELSDINNKSQIGLWANVLSVFFLNILFMCLFECLCEHMLFVFGCPGKAEEGIGFLDLEVVVSCLARVLWTKRGSSGWTVGTLNHQDSSISSSLCFSSQRFFKGWQVLRWEDGHVEGRSCTSVSMFTMVKMITVEKDWTKFMFKKEVDRKGHG